MFTRSLVRLRIEDLFWRRIRRVKNEERGRMPRSMFIKDYWASGFVHSKSAWYYSVCESQNISVHYKND